MGRILAIDYGKKRSGLAVTDPLQLIANPLDYVKTYELIPFLQNYSKKENVEAIVVGKPVNLNYQDTEMSGPANKLAEKLAKLFPEITIYRHDERFTSKMALQSMISGGSSKEQRKDKGNIDKISATIILQSFLESNKIR
ncbi:MAG: Holliday junction resolvase RuvX [Cyclobacteriaceae bacterium]